MFRMLIVAPLTRAALSECQCSEQRRNEVLLTFARQGKVL